MDCGDKFIRLECALMGKCDDRWAIVLGGAKGRLTLADLVKVLETTLICKLEKVPIDESLQITIGATVDLDGKGTVRPAAVHDLLAGGQGDAVTLRKQLHLFHQRLGDEMAGIVNTFLEDVGFFGNRHDDFGAT